MRSIGDTNHHSIKDAEELIVWFDKDEKFMLINSKNYPKWQAGQCKICPIMYNKSDGSPYRCPNKVQSFDSFKQHLGHAERTLGENIAFQVGCRKLPLPQYFRKFRRYGYLHDYTKKDSFLIFDVKTNRFKRVSRLDLPKLYTDGRNCTYCPCERKCSSTTNLLRHLQVLETKFYAFLIINDESQNDARNQERLQNFVNSLKREPPKCQSSSLSNGNIISKNRYKVEIMSDEDSSDEETSNNVHDISNMGIENDRYYEQVNNNLNDEEEDNLNVEVSDANTILKQMEESLKRSTEKMSDYIQHLRSKMNSTNLNQGLIDNQEKLILSKRTEDFQAQEKELTFYKKLNLNYEDLDFLMKKYGINDEYEICDSNLTLTVQLKGNCQANQFKPNSSINNLSIKNSSINKNSSISKKSSTSRNLVEEYQEIIMDTNSRDDSSNDNQIDYDQLESVLRNESIIDDSEIFKFPSNNCEQILVEGDVFEPTIKRELDLEENDDLPDLSKRVRID